MRERAARGPCRFTLLVPTPVTAVQRLLNPDDADRARATAVLERALPPLSQAAGSRSPGASACPSRSP